MVLGFPIALLGELRRLNFLRRRKCAEKLDARDADTAKASITLWTSGVQWQRRTVKTAYQKTV
jgi:hypothetical protein